MFIRPRRRGGSKSVSQGCFSVVSGCCNDDRFLENLIFSHALYFSRIRPRLAKRHAQIKSAQTASLSARQFIWISAGLTSCSETNPREQHVKSSTADVPRRTPNVGEGSRGKAVHKRWRCSQNELLNLLALWQPSWVGRGTQTAAEPPPPGPALTHKDPCLLQTQEVMCAFMWTRVNARTCVPPSRKHDKY